MIIKKSEGCKILWKQPNGPQIDLPTRYTPSAPYGQSATAKAIAIYSYS